MLILYGFGFCVIELHDASNSFTACDAYAVRFLTSIRAPRAFNVSGLSFGTV